MAVRSLRFVVSGEDKSATKTFDKVGKSAGRLGDKIGKGLGKGLGLGLKGLGGLALGAGAAGVAAVGMAPQVLAMAGALEQSAMKAETVFGPQQLASVKKWADANAHAMGLTKGEATGLAAGFGDLLIPMGFTREQAAKLSTETVGLSGALSQWSGGTKSAAEVSDILAAAMLGETDSLKSVGIAISAADIEARLAAKGQDKLKGAALEQAKALATQALIFEKSTDAQAAYKKSGGTLLGQTAKVSAQMKELRDKAIAGMAPMLLRVVGGVGRLTEGFRSGTGAGGKLREAVESARLKFEKYRPLLEVLAKGVAKFAGAILKVVIPAIAAFYGAMTSLYIQVVPKVIAVFDVLIRAAAKAFGWVPGLGPKLKTAAKEFGEFKDEVNRTLDAIKDKEIKIKLKEQAVAAFDAGTASGTGGGRRVVPRQQAVAQRTSGNVYLNSQIVGQLDSVEARKRLNGYRPRSA